MRKMEIYKKMFLKDFKVNFKNYISVLTEEYELGESCANLTPDQFAVTFCPLCLRG